MQFTREINRLVFGLLVLFGIVVLAATYWAVIGPDTILKRNDNPRIVQAEESILRGAIVDRNGTTLAASTRQDDGEVARSYLYPAMYSALGYYSFRYGVSGAESAFDPVLSGSAVTPNTPTTLLDSLLHRPQVGSDVQLTLDLNVQQKIAEAMQGQRGAAVVLSVPDGAVLAMISLPTYDPNTLDQDWDTLVKEPGNPFFNRVLQGSYQPGGALETPLMATAFLINHSIDDEYTQATDPVALDNLSLGCAVRLPTMTLTLRESYTFACPHPFQDLAQDLGIETVEATIDTFRLDQTPTLRGFVTPQPQATEAPAATVSPDDLTQLALGQGNMTVSPLNMAMMAAAIVNDGNTPQPYVLMNTRAPGATKWTPVQAVRPSIPLATSDTARQLQDLMRDAVANGAAQNAGRPDIDIGGHAALAYSGDGSLAWFVGFATFARKKGAAVAIVLENSSDPGRAADIGGTALAAAQLALAPPSS
ncbi:MAG TPA: penicillin-binding transpeptidase domain-containing protein [Phototrophicaceae bacterium]|nr:penicillin-binding transpeptidase domain-containing protein [Phototrophicaceae bacterium]